MRTSFVDEQKIISTPTKYLHLCELNQMKQTPNNSDRKENFMTPQKFPYSSMMCELAFSAKKFVEEQKDSNLKRQSMEEKEIDEWARKYDNEEPNQNKKRFSTRKSRMSMSPMNKNNANLLREVSPKENLEVSGFCDKDLDKYILEENISRQSDVILEYLYGDDHIRSKKQEEIYREWVKALSKEERGQKLYYETIHIYGWHPKMISVNKIERDMEILYGKGYTRRMKPGEEATVIEGIRAFLNRCKEKPTLIQNSTSSQNSKLIVNIFISHNFKDFEKMRTRGYIQLSILHETSKFCLL